MEINLELYKVFYEVATHKNISKTAEYMNISQPAITQSIKKLENILGLPLFYRKNKGVELTEEGKILFEHIKNSIETINNSQNIFSQYMNLDKGKIKIDGVDISTVDPEVLLSKFSIVFQDVVLFKIQSLKI